MSGNNEKPNAEWVLASELLDIAGRQSTDAAQAILELLSKHFKLKAATFFSFDPLGDTQTIRAQTGLDWDSWSAFQIPMTTPAGDAIRTGEIVVHYDIAKVDTYVNKELCRKHKLQCYIATPIPHFPLPDKTLETDSIKWSGAVCLYPDDAAELDKARDVMENVAPVIGRIYSLAVVHDQAMIRRKITEEAFSSGDTNSFMHKSLQVLKDNWKIEAGSIFLQDDRNKYLYMRATTGLDYDCSRGLRGDLKTKRKDDIYYRLDETSNSTVKCFLQREPIVFVDNPDRAEGKYVEKVAGQRRATVFVPIFEPPSRNQAAADPIGILRVTNRMIVHDGKHEVGSFAWEDMASINSWASLIGVVGRIMERSDRWRNDFQRTVHGAKGTIASVMAHLYTLHDRGPDMPEKLSFVVPDSISHLENLQFQIDRIESRDLEGSDLKIEPVLVYADVIVQARDLAEKLKNSMGIRHVEFTGLHIEPRTVPTVMASRDGLLVVFRNLIENSMKYCGASRICRISVGFTVRGDYLDVSITDTGIGIREADKPNIFDEGFRGDAAFAHDIRGTGYGLSQSRQLMNRMGGALNLHDTAEHTTFVVSMPLEEKEK